MCQGVGVRSYFEESCLRLRRKPRGLLTARTNTW